MMMLVLLFCSFWSMTQTVAWTTTSTSSRLFPKVGVVSSTTEPIITCVDVGVKSSERMKLALYYYNKKTLTENDEIDLLYASNRGDYNKVWHILSNDCYHRVNCQDQYGRTALHIASFRGCINIVRLLLDNDADIDTVDYKGRTPLHGAAKMGKNNVVALLLQHGANIFSQDYKGYTPLHYAAKHGQLDTVKFLLQNGANVHCLSILGKSPIDLACTGDWKEVAEYLSSYTVQNNPNYDLPFYASEELVEDENYDYVQNNWFTGIDKFVLEKDEKHMNEKETSHREERATVLEEYKINEDIHLNVQLETISNSNNNYQFLIFQEMTKLFQQQQKELDQIKKQQEQNQRIIQDQEKIINFMESKLIQQKKRVPNDSTKKNYFNSITKLTNNNSNHLKPNEYVLLECY